MASALAINGTPVSIPQLADYLQAQQFIHKDDFPAHSPAASARNLSALYAGRGHCQQGDGGGRGNQRGGRGGRGRNGGVRCQICSKQGHSAAFCYRRYSEPPPTAHVAVAGGGSAPASSPTVTTWLPDTGASVHATPDSSILTQSEEYHGDDVLRVGDGTGLAISRVGHAAIPSLNKSLQLSKILHVPELSASLLSVNRFTRDNNCYFEFHPNFFVVKDCTTKAVLLKGPSSGGLYSLSVLSAHYAFVSARATSMIYGAQRQLFLRMAPENSHKIQEVPPDISNVPWGSSPVLQSDSTIISPPPSAPSTLVPRAPTRVPRKRATRARPLERAHVMRLRRMTKGTGEQLHALTASTTDPTCYSQAVGHPQWRDAIDQEFNALLHNNTWQLVPATPNMNIVGCKWVFRTKRKANGSVERYKARLVAKGFN
ncbi:PREDICTED: uncharacterized protein LOC109147806 [Ipomoea nil]|uniref:uncharacterized protein LOC109147806 n=1 Tax=Ipomoea nil TaxID=35883 RepID=UPI000901F8A8|nr:PREDICTED: uncharacterized protein LOC109147806 [Ipomoea nil]